MGKGVWRWGKREIIYVSIIEKIYMIAGCCYNSSGRFLFSRTNINRYKASFLLSAKSAFNENYTNH